MLAPAALTGFDGLINAILVALAAAGALGAALVTFLLLLQCEVAGLALARMGLVRTFSLLERESAGPSQLQLGDERNELTHQ